jgi:hypothetical protein
MSNRKPFEQPAATELVPAYRVTSPYSGDKQKGSLEFIGQQGGNGSLPTYQEATGAPIETKSPLGLDVSWVAIIALNINQMIGTGVFSTREASLLAPALICLSMLISVDDSKGNWIGRPQPNLLGHRRHHLRLWSRGLY